jgi:hypothetical protein
VSRSRNTPHKPTKTWSYDTPGQWSGIKEQRKEHNRRTRNTFKQAVRNAKGWEDLDDQTDYEDFRPRGQAKWDL